MRLVRSRRALSLEAKYVTTARPGSRSDVELRRNVSARTRSLIVSTATAGQMALKAVVANEGGLIRVVGNDAPTCNSPNPSGGEPRHSGRKDDIDVALFLRVITEQSRLRRSWE